MTYRTTKEAAALTQLLPHTIGDDHYPLSSRVQILKAILHKLRPEPDPAEMAAGVVPR